MNAEPSHGSSRAWSWRHAVGKSGLPPLTRLVLHTLGLKMDSTGGSCFPPVTELVDLTGLDKKTVLKHLEVARENGWIEISKHGYGGQKWKRNEYTACWPGRDLQGTAASNDDEKGGGAIPPPSADKVVEMAPEGGGNGDHKVVEQLHQDKTLPSNIPVNSPTTAVRESVSKDDLKKIEAAFWSLIKGWKGFEEADKKKPLKLWMALTDEERAKAIRRYPAWRESFGSRTHHQAPSTYIGQKLWDAFPDPVAAPAAPLKHKALSKGWQALALSFLVQEPSAAVMGDMTAFQRKQVAIGGAAADVIIRDRQFQHGWRKVTEMYSTFKPVCVPAAILAVADSFVSYTPDHDVVAAWRRLYERTVRPWPRTDGADGICFPPINREAVDLDQAVADALMEFENRLNGDRSNDHAA